MDGPPQVLSMSYADDEQTVPPNFQEMGVSPSPPPPTVLTALGAFVLLNLTRPRSSSPSGDLTGHIPQQVSYHQSLSVFDNIVTRAAHCDLSAAERAQRQPTLMSSTLEELSTSLNGLRRNHHVTGTVHGTYFSESDHLLNGFRAQFGAQQKELSGKRSPKKVK
ncbi:hypothetical protein VSDG_03619 [Cytospora chrysosperma]|uniref:Uncharacterized protein n=1 Tax=Cytospora chrysosperma TaxID=252740 RepID=A0A423W9V8_CYTCH|nr:hypothetical protein VSDG_03619 [Valsa sordida]